MATKRKRLAGSPPSIEWLSSSRQVTVKAVEEPAVVAAPPATAMDATFVELEQWTKQYEDQIETFVQLLNVPPWLVFQYDIECSRDTVLKDSIISIGVAIVYGDRAFKVRFPGWVPGATEFEEPVYMNFWKDFIDPLLACRASEGITTPEQATRYMSMAYVAIRRACSRVCARHKGMKFLPAVDNPGYDLARIHSMVAPFLRSFRRAPLPMADDLWDMPTQIFTVDEKGHWDGESTSTALVVKRPNYQREVCTSSFIEGLLAGLGVEVPDDLKGGFDAFFCSVFAISETRKEAIRNHPHVAEDDAASAGFKYQTALEYKAGLVSLTV